MNSFLGLKYPFDAVIAFSAGMDSHAVAEIMTKKEEVSLARVRMKPRKGTKRNDQPFIPVPFSIKKRNNRKDSATPHTIRFAKIENGPRTRGFKFAMTSGLAAYLANVERIIVPESGQGALGPALIPVGHRYPDYRSSPLFTKKMESFLGALFGGLFRFEFPRIWNTKSETLSEFVDLMEQNEKDLWKNTKSCWRDSRKVSVSKKLRQCGGCAACMLRRMSVHAAGLTEDPDTYVCNNMGAATLEAATDPKFPESKLNNAFREYTIAGILHMDHLSSLANEKKPEPIRTHSTFLASALDIPQDKAEEKMNKLLAKHAREWREYVESLGPNSFVRKWAGTVR